MIKITHALASLGIFYFGDQSPSAYIFLYRKAFSYLLDLFQGLCLSLFVQTETTK